MIETGHTESHRGTVTLHGFGTELRPTSTDKEFLKEVMPSARYLVLKGGDPSAWPEDVSLGDKILGVRLVDCIPARLPDAILKASHLQYFSVIGCGAHELDERVWGLRNLRSLNYSGNHIAELPDFLGHMPRLQHMRFSKNAVSFLPSSLASAQTLVELDLRDNRLRDLPQWLSLMSRLMAETERPRKTSGLRVTGNPFYEPMASAVRRGGRDLVDAISFDAYNDTKTLVPAQSAAPVLARDDGKRIVRSFEPLTSTADASLKRTAGIRNALRSEAVILRSHVGNQNPHLGRALDSYIDTLSDPNGELDIYLLGFWGVALQKLVQTSSKEFLDEVANALDGLALNHSMFISQLPEWRDYLDNASSAALNEDAAREAASSLSGVITALERDEKSIEPFIPATLRALEFGVFQTAAYDKTNAYGLYKSVENVAIAMLDVVVSYTPSEAARFSGDVLKEVRSLAVKGLAGGIATILVACAADLSRLSDLFPTLFGWAPPLLRLLHIPI